MSRFIYAIVALVLMASLAACTGGSDTDPITTTLPADPTTTQTTTVITTTTEFITSDVSDITTTTKRVETTTTTKKTQQTSSGVVMYQNYPNVPDYGAMLGVTHGYTAMSGNENDSTGKQKVCFYFYNVVIITSDDWFRQ